MDIIAIIDTEPGTIIGIQVTAKIGLNRVYIFIVSLTRFKY